MAGTSYFCKCLVCMLFFIIVCLADRSESRSNKCCRVVNHLKNIFVTGIHTSSLLFCTSNVYVSSRAARYNTLTNEWSYMTSMSVARSHFGTTVCGSRIYCLGGYDSIHHLSTVEKFNPVTNRWHCAQGMQMRRFAVSAATLFVPLHKESACLDWCVSQRSLLPLHAPDTAVSSYMYFASVQYFLSTQHIKFHASNLFS